MEKRFVLVLGGVRSGKSDFAMKLASDIGEPVLFVATARNPALGSSLSQGDEEMRQRIAEHQRRRPNSWRTLEEPLRPASTIAEQEGGANVVLLDCVTVWAANVLESCSPGGLDTPDLETAQEQLADEMGGLHDWHRASPASLILVSNEVGMGLVPPYPSGRVFRDLLGWANQFLAVRATEVYLLVAGIPIELKALAATPWRSQ